MLEIISFGATRLLIRNFFQAVPTAMIPTDQFLGLDRSVTAGSVVWKSGNRELRPRLFNRGDDAPLGLYLVAASKEGCISTHRIEQKRLVGRWTLGTEHGLVGKVRIHGERAHLVARPLGIEGDSDSLVGLNAQGDDIRPKLLVRRARKESLRRAFEVHANFGELACQTLAGANVERHAGPAPVIDIRLD